MQPSKNRGVASIVSQIDEFAGRFEGDAPSMREVREHLCWVREELNAIAETVNRNTAFALAWLTAGIPVGSSHRYHSPEGTLWVERDSPDAEFTLSWWRVSEGYGSVRKSGRLEVERIGSVWWSRGAGGSKRRVPRAESHHRLLPSARHGWGVQRNANACAGRGELWRCHVCGQLRLHRCFRSSSRENLRG